MRGAMTAVLHASLVAVLLAFLVAALVVLGLVVAKPSVAHAGETDTIYSLVNEARWSQGSPGLVRNPAMDTVAANWAGALAQAGTLSHNPNYSSQIPGGWVAVGENVAQGYSGGSAMHDGWMSSPGHRANILGKFTDIGIAYLEAGGTTWGVQVFANYPGTVTPAAPAAPAAAPAPAAAAPAAAAPAAACRTRAGRGRSRTSRCGFRPSCDGGTEHRNTRKSRSQRGHAGRRETNGERPREQRHRQVGNKRSRSVRGRHAAVVRNSGHGDRRRSGNPQLPAAFEARRARTKDGVAG